MKAIAKAGKGSDLAQAALQKGEIINKALEASEKKRYQGLKKLASEKENDMKKTLEQIEVSREGADKAQAKLDAQGKAVQQKQNELEDQQSEANQQNTELGENMEVK